MFSDVSKSELFYFAPLIEFKVENTLFRVPREYFEESLYFLSTYPAAAGNIPRGLETNPICLNDVGVDEFNSFLKILINSPVGSKHFTTSEVDLEYALKLSSLWKFDAVRQTAISRLESLPNDPVKTVHLARCYGITHWIAPAVKSLVLRDESLVVDDVKAIGLELATEVFFYRDMRFRSLMQLMSPGDGINVMSQINSQVERAVEERFAHQDAPREVPIVPATADVVIPQIKSVELEVSAVPSPSQQPTLKDDLFQERHDETEGAVEIDIRSGPIHAPFYPFEENDSRAKGKARATFDEFETDAIRSQAAIDNDNESVDDSKSYDFAESEVLSVSATTTDTALESSTSRTSLPSGGTAPAVAKSTSYTFVSDLLSGDKHAEPATGGQKNTSRVDPLEISPNSHEHRSPSCCADVLHESQAKGTTVPPLPLSHGKASTSQSSSSKSAKSSGPQSINLSDAHILSRMITRHLSEVTAAEAELAGIRKTLSACRKAKSVKAWKEKEEAVIGDLDSWKDAYRLCLDIQACYSAGALDKNRLKLISGESLADLVSSHRHDWETARKRVDTLMLREKGSTSEAGRADLIRELAKANAENTLRLEEYQLCRSLQANINGVH